jgi:hypothetical protein
MPATLAESQGTPRHRTLGRPMASGPERWQRRRRDEGFNTHDLTVVHLTSYHPDTSAGVGVSPDPPKLPRDLLETLQDSDDRSFGGYD